MFSPTEHQAVKRCAIYCRVSSDPLKEGASTSRQLQNCRQFCNAREWKVTATYEDIDESAYKSTDNRPGLRALLEDMASGRFDTIVVWRLDRLVRRNDEFEYIWSICQRHNIALTSVTEPIDTTSGVGVAVTRMLVTFAGLESTIKSERLRAKNLEDARKGLPHRSGFRSYGYKGLDMHIVEHEAEIIREAATRILAGEAPNDLARELANRGVVGRHGAPISGVSLRKILKNPTIAGERTYHGHVIAKGTWEPILDPLTATKVRYMLTMSKGGRRRKMKTQLLSGLLRCGICGNSLASRGAPLRYGCGGPCSKTNSVHLEHTNNWVTELVLWRLEKRWPANGATPTLADDKSHEIVETLDSAIAAATRLNIARYIDGTMSHVEYVNARTALETKIGQQLHRTSNYVPSPVLPPDFDPRKARRNFHLLTMKQQQAVVELEIDHIIVTPGTTFAWDQSRFIPNYWQVLPKGYEHLPIPDFDTYRRGPMAHNPTLQPDTLRRLYHTEQKTLQEIAAIAGCNPTTIVQHLKRNDISFKNSGNDIYNRYPIPEADLRRLYLEEQLCVGEIADRLETSRLRINRNLENYKIPIRPRFDGEAPLVILDELHQDPIVLEILQRHDITPQPQAGTLAERFPEPQPVNTQLITELYTTAGLSTRQIELATGILQKRVAKAIRNKPEIDIRSNQQLASPASRRYRTRTSTRDHPTLPTPHDGRSGS